MLNTLQRMRVLSLAACGLISSAQFAQAGSNAEIAQSGPSSDPVSPRAPVPFARKAPVSVPATTPNTAPRRTASSASESAEPTDVISRGDLDRAGAKAAVEADGYKRVTILGAGPNGTWRAQAYRGDAEVALSVAADGSVSME